MAKESNIRETVQSLFEGMDSLISAKTVVGEAMKLGDTTIIPLMDVSFGIGAGAFGGERKNNDGGGIGGKLSPCALLIISNGSTKLVNVKNQTNLNKILDMVPDIVNRFGKRSDSGEAEDIDVKEEDAVTIE